MSLNTELQKYTLTASERRELRLRLLAYMAYHPLTDASVHTLFRRPRRLGGLFWLWRIPLRGAVGLAVALVVVVPFAAERALPGDTLYPIKVRFNEGLRAQLLLSPYERIEWEAKRLERRVAEARLLAKEGKLTEETEEALEETVRAHATAFQAELATLGAEDAENAAVAAVALESALDVQSAVLNTDIANSASTTTVGGDISGLAGAVAQARASVASSTTATVPLSYEPLVGRVTEQLTKIRVRTEDATSELTDSDKTAIRERLALSERVVAQAKAVHESGDDVHAAELLRPVLAATQKLLAFLNDKNLRAQVTLDALVPLPLQTEPTEAEEETEEKTEPAEEGAAAQETVTAKPVFVPIETPKSLQGGF